MLCISASYRRKSHCFAHWQARLIRLTTFVLLRMSASRGVKFRRPADTWPDYYDDLPGGLPEGRALMAEPFNIHELAARETRLSVCPPMLKVPM